MNATRHIHRVGLRRGGAAIVAILALALSGAGAAAHGPDPTLSGGAFGQNQDLRFRWRSGSEPTAVIKTAIRAAAADANATRASKAATFTYDAAGSNPIGYGTGATCGVNGLACFTRTVPSGFTIWLREQGHVYDWGTLKWCQSYSSPPNGCYDAETITLDELGHVEGLDHHVNYSSGSDYEDAVVQTFSRTKPSTGWNRHAFGRCDVATLQRTYDVSAWTTKYSSCLDLTTVVTLSASPSGILVGNATTLTATLAVVDLDSYARLGGNPIAGRTVTLQRRPPGATTWTTVGTMPGGSTAGTYVLAQRPSVDTEFRAVYTASGEGLNGDTSPTIRIYVSTCSGSIPGALHPDVACL
jgi:hypothetical protein